MIQYVKGDEEWTLRAKAALGSWSQNKTGEENWDASEVVEASTAPCAVCGVTGC